ncbi:DUF7601 domain-containing protein [Paenibacillus rigui]|uniref:Big-1 domain-containing protein n=1 Tax=Paenibacillus rigui TaxID=554312 RepID=A0A229UHN0_9BACL|nr:carboxypeptidase regulatory-like domain-containing protein [Paenibacillus rigui]OXM82896.1 hypothetical protein CF651_28185 [Paenibacillus rigui]
MKRKRSVSKSLLSCCLAVLLVLQTMAFSATANADSAPGNSETAVASEPSVHTAVYAAPEAATLKTLESNPADKTAVLKGANTTFSLEVVQDSKAVNTGGIIQGRQPFTLTLSNIKVPVFGDNQSAAPESIILKNDKVIFDKATYFPMVNLTATGSKDIMLGGLKIATVAFTATTITITFDGDDTFFNGAKKDVLINLSSTAKADVSGVGYGAQAATQIFGANYLIDNPALTPKYTIAITPQDITKPSQYSYVNLNGTSFVNGTITWKVDVAAFDRDDNTIPLPLDGKTFYDNLSEKGLQNTNAAGAYVEGSFTVDGQSATPVYANGALSYTFPDASTPEASRSKATITFKTWIPKGLYYYEYHTVPGNDGGQKLDTTAQLKDTDEKLLVEAGSYRINIYPDWIQKYGAVSKQGNDTLVTWTIDVNKNYHKQGLKSFTITDALPTGLSFESAAYQQWDTGTSNWSTTSTPIDPDEGTKSIYSFGTVNDAVRLVIVSKVVSDSTFTNRARANWSLEDPPGGLQNNDATMGNEPNTVSDYATVTVGAHSITKSGSASYNVSGSVNDYDIAAITWNVNVTPQYEDPNLAVYDLLRYDASFDITKVDENSQVSNQVLTEISKKLYGNTWQQYQADSFKGDAGLTLEVIPLTQGGKTVADLLKVTGFKDTSASFTFRSFMTNPNDFAGQYTGGQPYRHNRAYLFSGNTFLGNGDAYPQVFSRMLNKEMLFASIPLKADGTPENVKPNNVGSYIRDDSNEAWTIAAYDRVTKTVTFRLAVNIPGLKTDQMTGVNRVATDIKLVDTLPAGWEFVKFSEENGKDYELYEGLRNIADYGKQINSIVKVIEPNDPHHVVSFSAKDNVGTFSFTKLESPYVILVKARPTAEAMNADFMAGKTKHEGFNTAELKIKWGDVEKVIAESRKVIVPLSPLGKSATKPAPGIQEWTVNYAPSFAMKDGVYLQDTLGAGLKLREDENGNPSLTPPDMAVYRAKITASGALERVGAALDLTGPDPEVKVEMQKSAGNPTKLIFKIKDPNQFYQFVYQTESSGMSPGKVGNKIELLGDDSLPAIMASSESTLDANDVSGSAGSNGVLYILKVDPANKPLIGVEITLYEADGVTAAKDQQGKPIKGITDANGRLTLLIPTPGLYQLKQTYIDENTYLPTTTVYPVRVANVKDSPVFVGGELVTSTKPLVVPTPVWETGDLKLDMQLEGKAADSTKDFSYKVTFSNGKSYDYYDASGTKLGTVANGGTITLKGGNVVTFKGIPDGIIYTIVQDDYTSNGYITNPADLTRTGKIVKSSTVDAHYVNAKYLDGQLTVSQTVAGNGGEMDKLFTYTVKFDDADPGKQYSYTYTKIDGTSETGTIQSGGKFALKHGENIVIAGISKGTVYTVTENDYTADEYVVNLPEWKSSGTIADGEDAKVSFVNTRMVYGGLLIGQTVAGNGGEMDKLFTYTVKFDGVDPSKEYMYTYTKIDGTNETRTIQSSGTISLKHGETAIFDASQILQGGTYTVSQTDYTSDGYTTDPETLVHTGTIVEKKIAEARFVNTRYLSSTLTLTANPAIVPGDGKTPSKITATLIDHDGKPVVGREIVLTLPDNSVVTATTDSEGKAVIPYTPPLLTETAPKQHTITSKTTSTSDGDATASTTVTAMPAAITGVLRNNTTGKVIPNATVTVKNDDTNELHTITTDENGAYFLAVPPGGSYTVNFTQMVNINGSPTPITFAQKAKIDGGVTEGEAVPAEITAVGVMLFKQSDGKSVLLNNAFAGKLHIYLKDAHGNYLEDNGVPKAFDVQSNGTFLVDGLSTGAYTMEVRYEFNPGKELTLIRDSKLTVAANGELNISQGLVDPYGIITDATTGATIEGAEVTLYYADTPRNKANGIVPGTKVTLPAIPGFAPNDNASPSQNSDGTGAYAYMVFPDTDYYLVVTKAGYVMHTSATINVGTDIVRYDVQLTRETGSGNGNSGSDNDNSGSDNGNNGAGNSNNGAGNSNNGSGNSNNGAGNSNNGAGNSNNGAGNSNNGAGNSNNGADNGNNGAGNSNNGAGNSNNGSDNGNNGSGNSNNGSDNGNNGADNGNNGSDNGNNGSGNSNNGSGNSNNGAGNSNNGAGNSNNGSGNSNNGADNGNNGSGNSNNGAGNSNNGADNGNNGTDNGNSNNGADNGNSDNELDDVPKTGDNSISLAFYMALVLMSLITIGFCLPNSKKKKYIQ